MIWRKDFLIIPPYENGVKMAKFLFAKLVIISYLY
nr:MAG TPA: hypothetical protein [Caudoviricetes sp.]